MNGTRPLMALALLALALASPAWAATTRCTTYEEKTMGRWQTLCSDDTRRLHNTDCKNNQEKHP
jgi:hypothetical protein